MFRPRDEYLWNDKVSVIERGIMKVNKNVVITQFWDVGFLGVFETVKTILACNVPLLSSHWCHDGNFSNRENMDRDEQNQFSQILPKACVL